MTPVVVPFRAGGKSRLPAALRGEIALAMLGDVLEAAGSLGAVRLVTDDPAAELLAGQLGVEVMDDPGEGQGAAVAAGLRTVVGPCVVVNADVPGVRPSDLTALAEPARRGALALVAARDGTTNALAFPDSGLFVPLYGSGSAERFRDHAAALGLRVEEPVLPSLVDDVDTLADLERVGTRAGRRTRALLGAVAVTASTSLPASGR